jgi:integrase
MNAKKKITVKPYHAKIKPHLKYQCYYPTDEGRKRTFFKTKKEADAFRLKKIAEYERIGNDAKFLSDNKLRKLIEAEKILDPYDVDIVQAAKFYVKHVELTNRSITFKEAVPEFLEYKEKAGLSKIYIKPLKYRFDRILKSFSKRLLVDITGRELSNWISRLSLSPVSKNNYRLNLSAFYSWSVKMGYCEENPIAAVARVKNRNDSIEIFTVSEMNKMISVAQGDVLAFLTIGGFGGLRSSEIERLNWSDINLAKGFIDLSASKTKTAQRRLVYYEDNLSQFINLLCKVNSPVCEKGFERRLRNFKKEIEHEFDIRWKKNGLRHSFATYYMAMSNDSAKTSMLLGQSNQDVVFKHYRDVVSEEEGKMYFDIFPTATDSCALFPEINHSQVM